MALMPQIFKNKSLRQHNNKIINRFTVGTQNPRPHAKYTSIRRAHTHTRDHARAHGGPHCTGPPHCRTCRAVESADELPSAVTGGDVFTLKRKESGNVGCD